MTTKEQALAAYDLGTRLAVISQTLGVSMSQISHWAKASGRTRRKRGNRKREVPSDHVKAILRLAARHPYHKVAEIVGTTRQNVADICQTWAERWWKIEPPFHPGDVIVWYGMRFTIISVADHVSGVVRGEDGEVVNFKWSDGRNRALLAPQM